MLNSVLTESLTLQSFLICTACSIILGGIVAFVHSKFSNSSKGFVMTIALMPAIVQMVIMLVNGNLGTGVAVMGAFSLVRFRSIPGHAKEITSIFMAMAIGLATGTGYLTAAGLFVFIIIIVICLYNFTGFGEKKQQDKDLNITIPEGLDYSGVFDDLFEKYTNRSELIMVKTANMGSLYKLSYRIGLKNQEQEKAFIDELRCRNGNLEISCKKASFGTEEL